MTHKLRSLKTLKLRVLKPPWLVAFFYFTSLLNHKIRILNIFSLWSRSTIQTMSQSLTSFRCHLWSCLYQQWSRSRFPKLCKSLSPFHRWPNWRLFKSRRSPNQKYLASTLLLKKIIGKKSTFTRLQLESLFRYLVQKTDGWKMEKTRVITLQIRSILSGDLNIEYWLWSLIECVIIFVIYGLDKIFFPWYIYRLIG